MKKNNSLIKQDGFTEFLIYTTPNAKVKVEIYLYNETVWLSQAKIAELFGVDRSVITKHLLNIYADGELAKEATCANFAQVQNEGQRQVKREENKLHLAISKQTAAEIVYSRADSQKENMGLISWKNTPSGKVSHEVAVSLAENEFEKYRVIQAQLYESDFDREIKKLKSKKTEGNSICHGQKR